MESHYFSRTPSGAHRPGEATLTVGGTRYTLLTDAGVFSKDHVDRGTRLLIEAMEKERIQLPEEGRICDLGCGYGPIGIAAAILRPHAEVMMIDVNERAVELARQNVERCALPNVKVQQADGLAGLEATPFRLVVTNPPIRTGKVNVQRLLTGAYEALEPGGSLAVVIRTQQGARSLAKFLEGLFGSVDEVLKGGGFRVYEATRT